MDSTDNCMDDAECEKLIREFCEITEVDEALAHYMLQENDFDLNRALTAFFSSCQNQPSSSANEGNSSKGVCGEKLDESKEENDDADGNSNSPSRPNNLKGEDDDFVGLVQFRGLAAKRAYQTENTGRDGEEQLENTFPQELTLLSWNVDGLDERNRLKRFNGALYVIAKTNPEVIFLQEMIDPLLPQLNGLLAPMYNVFIQQPNCRYFCITLVSKNIKIMRNQFIPFKNTSMGRGILVVEGEWQRMKLKLLNSHLESTKEYSAVRSAQFSECVDLLTSLTAATGSVKETLSVFGGDMNIRDKEIESLPVSIRDAWVHAGARAEYRYTWDLKRNDNYEGRFGKGQPRARFDRILFSGPPNTKVDFHLEGINRIKGPNCFISDHFALVCRFLLAKNSEKDASPSAVKSKRSKLQMCKVADGEKEVENLTVEDKLDGT